MSIGAEWCVAGGALLALLAAPLLAALCARRRRAPPPAERAPLLAADELLPAAPRVQRRAPASAALQRTVQQTLRALPLANAAAGARLGAALPQLSWRATRWHWRATARADDAPLLVSVAACRGGAPAAAHAARIGVALRVRGVLPLRAAAALPSGALLCVVPCVAGGSLRDALRGVAWHADVRRKRLAARRAVPAAGVSRALLVRLLGALRLLARLGVPLASLHAGNLLRAGERVLLDVTHALTGARPRYLALQRRFAPRVPPEIVAFGATLFELAHGDELERLGDVELVSDRVVREQLLAIFGGRGSGPVPTFESLMHAFAGSQRRVFRDASDELSESQCKFLLRARRHQRRLVSGAADDADDDALPTSLHDCTDEVLAPDDSASSDSAAPAPGRRRRKKKAKKALPQAVDASDASATAPLSSKTAAIN